MLFLDHLNRLKRVHYDSQARLALARVLNVDSGPIFDGRTIVV